MGVGVRSEHQPGYDVLNSTENKTMIAPSLEQQVATLQLRLNEAFARITQLEHRTGPVSSRASNQVARALLPLDSPEVAAAFELLAEIFPGSQASVEIECDPAEPHWPWYSFTVRWQGEIQESIEKELLWHERLAAAYSTIGDQFRLFVAFS